MGSDVWKWNARQIADGKFTMRFPNSKMVSNYSQFKLGMKTSNVQLLIEPWSSSIGAKGQLQQGWFRVRGIPTDQRNLRTIAKIGGLVGKTISIDEKTRYSHEFVKIKIACRDIYVVPETVESTLGVFIYDFAFELEEDAEQREHKLKSGVKIHEYEPHSPVLRNKRWITTPWEVIRQVILLVIPTRILLIPNNIKPRKLVVSLIQDSMILHAVRLL